MSASPSVAPLGAGAPALDGEKRRMLVPGQPVFRCGANQGGMLLKFDEVMEGIAGGKASGLDHAHDYVTNPCAGLRAMDLRAIAPKDAPFDESLDLCV